MKSHLRNIAATCCLVLGFAVMAGTPARAQSPATAPTDQKDKQNQGKFVSYKDGTLILKGNYGGLVWHDITEKTKVVQWDYAAGEYQPSGTAEVLGKVEPGAWVMVTAGRALVRVGARKERIIGTFRA